MQQAKDIIQRLKDGNARFVADRLDGKLQQSSRRNALMSGQAPYAIILSCADSRVVPELAFDTGLGELFVIRVAGNIANTSSIASIEYAVAHLGSPVVVVMGHENCGAVTAALTDGDKGYNLNHLLAHIEPAKAVSADPSVNAVVKTHALLTVGELIERSAIIRAAVDNGELELIPAYYSLETGEVLFL